MIILLVPLLLLFLTFLEFYILFLCAIHIGIFPVIGLSLFTAAVGGAIIRQQGLETLSQLRENMTTQSQPIEPLIHGAFLLAAAPCLLTPGFITDCIGFMLLIPPVRVYLARLVLGWVKTKIDEGHVKVDRHRF